MKISETYRNRFPLEELLPTPVETDVEQIVANCDYTWEADKVSMADFPDDPMARVNTADATVFFLVGYEAARKRLEEILQPI